MNAMTVSALSAAIKESFQRDFGRVMVEGEISGFSASGAGHWYFSLKDQRGDAMIKCVMFRGANSQLNIRPQDGDQVVLIGSLDFYKGRGDCQIICQQLQVAGDGILLARLAKLKKALEAEGLFAPERKKPIPPYPKRIGVITSATGAAVQDIIHTCGQLAPWVEILVYPAMVQGEGCPADVIRQIAHANADARADVLIVGRGGGSLEDLIGFSDEGVVRAIAASEIPILSAVGHATDDTMLSDFVADAHAITPTKAAEALCLGHARLKEAADKLLSDLPERMKERYRQALLRFQAYNPESLEMTLMGQVQSYAQKVDYLIREQEQAIDTRIKNSSQHIYMLTETLKALNPEDVLKRGFAVIEDASGHIISDGTMLSLDEEVCIRWQKSSRRAQITEEK